jgi:YjbE family integral membrane protein
MDAFGPDILPLIEIIWVNVVLSGDNAVVIAMACRGLPENKRRWGMLLGAGAAVVLRIAFTLVLAALLATPYLKIVGGLLLFWVALKLINDSDAHDQPDIRRSSSLFEAVRTVAIADAVMSLDNVLAIEAVAQGSVRLLIVGLLVSIPLIVAGATLIMKLLDRVPILVWAGAGLLGWLSGEMMVTDPAIVGWIGAGTVSRLSLPASVLAAALVLLVGFILVRVRRNSRPAAPAT